MRKINPDLQKKVASAALPLTHIRSRTKPWFESKNPFSTLLEMNIEENIKIAGGVTEEELIVDGEVMACAIMRGTLQVSQYSHHHRAMNCFVQSNRYCSSVIPLVHHDEFQFATSLTD